MLVGMNIIPTYLQHDSVSRKIGPFIICVLFEIQSHLLLAVSQVAVLFL